MHGCNHVDILAQAINGRACIDQRVKESARILALKMEQLRDSGEMFEGVNFSPYAQRIVNECRQLV